MTPERLPPYQLIMQYRALFLRHEPQRFARMLTPDEAERQQEKYHDASGIITDEMLFEQLVGARQDVPCEANGLAHMLPLDVDSGGLQSSYFLTNAISADAGRLNSIPRGWEQPKRH